MERATLAHREVLVAGPKRIVRDGLVMPDGQEIDWYYVDTPPSVMIVPITAERNVVMVRQWRQNLQAHVLELPAGAIEEGEDALDAARRELREETGYQLNIGAGATFKRIADVYARPSETVGYTHMLLAHPVVRAGEPTMDSLIERYLDMSVVVMPIEEAIAQIGRSITSAETISALTLATR